MATVSLAQLLAIVKVDFKASNRQPKWSRVAVATFVALLGSLVADAVLVAIGKNVYPATKSYVHYQVTDYAKLTIVGVVIACAGWPIVTRISTAPRWLFARLAVVVSLVLLAPDAYIWLVQKQSGAAVFVLVWMHLAIALVTYFSLVVIAPGDPLERSRRQTGRH